LWGAGFVILSPELAFGDFLADFLSRRFSLPLPERAYAVAFLFLF